MQVGAPPLIGDPITCMRGRVGHMTDNFGAIPSATIARPAARPSTIHFGLRSLLLIPAVCAVVAALYGYFGDGVMELVKLGAAACLAVFAVTWLIDASLAIRDMSAGILRPRSNCDDQGNDSGADARVPINGIIDGLRIQEQIAAVNYDARRGPREDFLRARAVRLLAEIAVMRANADRRVSRHQNQVCQDHRDIH